MGLVDVQNAVLRVARGEINYVEGGGPDGKSGNITKYWAELDPALQGQYWCAGFVSWVFKHAGFPLPQIDRPYGFMNCISAVNFAKAHGLWDESGHYSAGDIILFDWASNSLADHTGFVVDDDGTTIHTIEGNTSSDDKGSQNNGGGVYPKTRSHGPVVMGVLSLSKLVASGLLTGAAPAPVPAPQAAPAPAPAPPPAPAVAVPAFPLPAGAYFGPANGGPLSISGYYGHAGDLAVWQRQMASRGWSIAADGHYGPQTADITRKFQAEKGLAVDGCIGPHTWRAAWTTAVTA